MQFSTFILDNLDRIVAEWVVFAREVAPAGDKMSPLALADHCPAMLTAIAQDMQACQDKATRQAKPEGESLPPPDARLQSAASAHGKLRQRDGFDLDEMVSEFRALRASVLKLWRDTAQPPGDRRQAVEEIARFNEGIDQALAESVKQYTGDVAKSRDLFLGVLGHDLRGPLSTIENSTAVLDMPNAAQDTLQQAAGRIRRASRRMKSLINDLLDYTSTRSGHGLTVRLAACDLHTICEEAIDAARTAHPQQPFTAELAGDLVVQADEKRLEQVLSNLLNNAVQHGFRGSPIGLTAHGDADSVFVTVKNLGRPIPPESMATIFEPLVQVTVAWGEADRAHSSIGLGLFIVREIVRGHHGSIDVASFETSGTVFTVRLPRLPVEASRG